MPPKILITGSSELPPKYHSYAQLLGERLITRTKFELVNGGLISKGSGKNDAIDGLVINAAAAAVHSDTQKLRSRVLTMLPEKDIGKFRRLDKKTGTVVHIPHSGLRTRRYTMALSCDAVVAVHGGDAAGNLIDLAFVANKPVIPIPCTGGTAEDRWDKYEKELVSRLNASTSQVESLKQTTNAAQAIDTCIELLHGVLRPRCFVAMPFTNHPLDDAFVAIREAIERHGYQAVRIDRETFIGNVVEAIWNEIRQCDAVVADITNSNPNVFYELGIAHSLDKPTVLVVFDPNDGTPIEVPFNISVQRVLPYATRDVLKNKVSEHLDHLRKITQ